MYLGQNTKAGVMMTADILALFSFYRFSKEYDILTKDFQIFAEAKAGLQRGSSDNIYHLAQMWRSAEEHNRAMRLWARNSYLINNDLELYELRIKVNTIPEDTWNWANESDFMEYKRIRRDRQSYDLYKNFAMGALLVNRFISTIDGVLFANRLKQSNNQLYALPNVDNKGVSLIYEIKF